MRTLPADRCGCGLKFRLPGVPIRSFCDSFDMSGELTVSGSLGTGWPAGPSPEAAVTTG